MKDVKNLKLTYIGGGSRGWAYALMNDLAQEGEIGGRWCYTILIILPRNKTRK